jgi:thiazole/oxazole-forming peptide maturase SagD family component
VAPARLSTRARVWVLPAADGAPIQVALATPSGATDTVHGQRLTPCFGGGRTRAEAARRARDEFTERRTAFWHPDIPTVIAPFAAVAERAVPPNALLCASARQLRLAAPDPTARDSSELLGLEPHRPMAWTPARSLVDGAERLVPSRLVWFGHPARHAGTWARADSNGCAAGRTRADATQRALLELIERDAVAQWWYQQPRRPRVAPGAMRDPLVRRVLAWLAAGGRESWVLDLTGDLGVPVAAAVSVCRNGPHPRVLMGFAARLSMGQAVRRALVELAQEEAIVRAADDGLLRQLRADRHWLRHGTLAAHPHLVPDDRASRVRARTRSTPQATAGVRQLVHRLVNAELSPLLVTFPSAKAGSTAVKAIVPGLRPWWPRFAPGRLYVAPVRAGWVDVARTEAQLNPFAIWF